MLNLTIFAMHLPFTLKHHSKSHRKSGLWALVIFIYAFYIWGHIPISNVCYALSDQYTPSVYRYYVQLTGQVLLIAYITGLVWLLARSSQKLLKTIVWLVFATALVLSYESLVKIAIEYVHFIQYCVFTILLCKIFAKRQYVAILLALLAGFVDEVYQAYPAEPLNWRDIMLNVTGVVWGWLMFWTLQDVKKD